MKNCGKNTVMETLNNFYSFLLYQNIPHTNMCIFPNQNGEYRQISELKREEGDINDRLKNIRG